MNGLLLTLAAGLLGSQAPQEPPPERTAFVELRPAVATCFEQQAFDLVVQFGFDRDFHARHGIELFHRRLDVSMQLSLPWLRTLPGVELLPGSEGAGSAAGGSTFVLDDGMGIATAAADRTVEGRVFQVFEWRQRLLPQKPGELRLPGASLRFAYATRFTEDFVNGRQPADRHEAEVQAMPAVVQVQPLPAAGRPAGFTGAVGTFAIAAEAAPGKLMVGAHLRLVLRITGNGNLDRFAAPSLAGLDGFHVQGQIDDRGSSVRTLTCDLVPLRADLRSVPPIELSFFDPGPPAGYRVARTAPVPLQVLPLPPGQELDPRLSGAAAPKAQPGVDDLHDLLPPQGGERWPSGPPPSALVVAALLLPWFGVWLLATALHRQRHRRADHLGNRARSAFAVFQNQVAQTGAEPQALLVEYLAARLRCPPAAVIGHELAARLLAAGVPGALADTTAAQVELLVAARYGGGGGGDAARLRTLVEQLEAAFARQDGRR